MAREKIARALKECRLNVGLTTAQVGELIGKSQKTVSAWENNRGQPDADTFMELCEIYKVSDIKELFGELPDKETVAIPLLDLSVSAGTGQTIWEGCDFEYKEYENAPKNADWTFRIRGDSMEPNYCDGDIVFVKTDIIVEQGQVGIFNLNDEYYLKMLQGNKLVSINTKYKPILIDEWDTFRCIGKVVGKAERK